MQPPLAELRGSAQVPDDYSISMRALGLYPLTRLPFAAGIARWHAETRSAFEMPIEALPIRGQLRRYGPPPSGPKPAPQPSLDALGVPVFSAAQAAALFLRHAPMLEIDVAGDFDRMGALTLGVDDQVIVDAAAPIVYTRLAYTLLGGLIHPQLVYTFWFSERPPSSDGAFDLLAGKLDGVVWRVTLDSAGEALVYDSMHACGCYHLFFPTEKVVARDLPETLDETLFVPQAAPPARPGEKVVLRSESGTHYLQRVSMTPETRTADAVTYQLQDERMLTTLPRRGGGSRSVYDFDGLIPGSERAERWFFWPMGIRIGRADAPMGAPCDGVRRPASFRRPAAFRRLLRSPPLRARSSDVGNRHASMKIRVATYNIHKGVSGSLRKRAAHSRRAARAAFDGRRHRVPAGSAGKATTGMSQAQRLSPRHSARRSCAPAATCIERMG